MAAVNFEEVVHLVERLTRQEQRKLLRHLQTLADQRELTVDEKKALLDSVVIDAGPISPHYSDRREDWYDDDGQ
jgi:hypothetical protein